MNLVILVGHFPPGPFGGAERQAEEWARRLAARHAIAVVTRRDPVSQPKCEERDGFRVIRVRVLPVPGLRTFLDLMAIRHTVGRLRPRPEMALCFQTFISGLAGVEIQHHLSIPSVVWIRGEGEYQLGSSLRMRTIGPRVWRRSRGVLVQSETIRAAFLQELAKTSAGLRDAVAAKLEVVPNGIDLPPRSRVPRNAGGEGSRILVVGRLIPDKGVDVVLDAVAAIGGRVTIVGEGPSRATLTERARRLGLDARFEGFVAPERLNLLYDAAGCVVLAARRGEGLPNALLEAMARGIPVVATPVAGIRDLVVDGKSGLLVPRDDARALQAALSRLETDPGFAERLGRAGRAAVEEFAWSRVMPRLEAVLERWRDR